MTIFYSSLLNMGLGLGHTVISDYTFFVSLLSENSRSSEQSHSAEE